MGDREIALIEDPAERDAIWEEYYFSKWGMLANRKRQSIVEAFWNDPGVAKIDELLKDNEVYIHAFIITRLKTFSVSGKCKR